jgi:hypothetical protein
MGQCFGKSWVDIQKGIFFHGCTSAKKEKRKK